MLHQLPGNPVELRDPVPVPLSPTISAWPIPSLCRRRMLAVWLSYRMAVSPAKGAREEVR